MNPELFADTFALFAPLVEEHSPGDFSVERNISYGGHARHLLDVFCPATAVRGRPVLVFVHGGGFVGGDKGAAGDPFYNNIATWATRAGLIGVTMTYRLAPGAPWPAGAEDVATVVSWLRTNITEYGGDPTRIFLMGQSAGAAHVANYVAMPALHGPGPRIAGAIMLSGLYDIARLEPSSFEAVNYAAYYGEDASRCGEQSSLSGLIATQIPTLFTVSEYDPPSFQGQAALLVTEYLQARGVWPRILFLPDHNHLSSATQIGLEGDTLSPEIYAFICRFSGPTAEKFLPVTSV